MVSSRRFYRAVFKVEVLSEDPIDDELGLSDIEHEITVGAWSGRKLDTEFTELSATETAEKLKEHGSDPEFFRLDDEGNDLDEDEGA